MSRTKAASETAVKKVLQKTNERLSELQLLKSQTDKEITTLKKEIRDLHNKLKNLEEKEVVVTDHAIVRYFERIKGFDIDKIKQEIVDSKAKDLIEKLGPNGTYPNDNGARLVLKQNRVLTILEQ